MAQLTIQHLERVRELRAKGLPITEICKKLNQEFDLGMSPTSLYAWIKKADYRWFYLRKAEMLDLPVRRGDTMQDYKNWFFDILEYLLMQSLIQGKHRDTRETVGLFLRALKQADFETASDTDTLLKLIEHESAKRQLAN